MVTGVGPVQIAKCVVCGSDKSSNDPNAAQLVGLKRPYGIRRCDECGMRWQSPRPTTQQLAALYARAYFGNSDDLEDDLAPYAWTPEGTRRYDRDAFDCVVQQQRHHLDRLRAAFPERGRLLEVGCGQSGFLHRARADGWTVLGIEPNDAAAAAERAQGLDVTTSNLEDYTPSEPVDVVFSSHVLEHFADPAAALQRMASWLTDRGVIYLEVPNQFEAWTRRLSDGYRGWTGRPRPTSLYSVHHLSFFGPSHLARLFEDAGLEVEVTGWSPLPPRGAHRWLGRLDRVAGHLARQAGNLQAVGRRR